MDSSQNISITEPTTAANVSDDSFGYEADRKRHEKSDLITKNMKSQFKPWRVFINHIDSYHGRLLTDVSTFFLRKLRVFLSISPTAQRHLTGRVHQKVL